MKKMVEVKNVKIGEGGPKICVPIVGETIEEILQEARFLKPMDFDLVEWRADFYEDVENIINVKFALKEIANTLKDKPIIFTFRSFKEGGEKEVSTEFYFELNKSIIQSKLADIVDIELFNDEKEIKSIINLANDNKVAIIISNHDFEKTPSKDEIILRLKKAISLDGHIAKIAVMPRCKKDVLTLLDATNTMAENHKDRPIITISMGQEGIISRLAGGIFGSDITFASAKKLSAPGQISSTKLREVMDILYGEK